MSEEKEFVPLEEYFSNDIDFGFTAVESDEDDSPPVKKSKAKGKKKKTKGSSA